MIKKNKPSEENISQTSYHFNKNSWDVYTGTNAFDFSFKAEVPVIIFTLCHTQLNVVISSKKQTLDIYSVFLVKKNELIRLQSDSSYSRFIVFKINKKTLKDVSDNYPVSKDILNSFFKTSASIPRNTWLNELVHRILFEGEFKHESKISPLVFLIPEMIKQIYYNYTEKDILIKSRLSIDYFQLDKKSDLIRKIILYIEVNLFKKISLDDLARKQGTTISTIKKSFQEELKINPATYIRDRKLEESYRLIKGHKKNISEVAYLVGYESVHSFYKAFKNKYHILPSKVANEDAPF